MTSFGHAITAAMVAPSRRGRNTSPLHRRRGAVHNRTETAVCAAFRLPFRPNFVPWLVSTALVVERDALGLPFVPHTTEDRARMETDTEADEKGDQRNDNAGGAIAFLARGDLVREEE